MRYQHALHLFKNWNTHSIESGGFFELLISKKVIYEGWNFNSGNYLFTTDTK